MTNIESWKDTPLDNARKQIQAWLDELESTYEKKIETLESDINEALTLLEVGFDSREATSDERAQYYAIMEKYKKNK